MPSYRAGTIINLECDLGYKPVSGLKTTCQKSGVWDPSVPNYTVGKELYVIDTLQEILLNPQCFQCEKKNPDLVSKEFVTRTSQLSLSGKISNNSFRKLCKL